MVKTCRNTEDIEVDCETICSTVRDHIYTITIPKSIDGPSTTSILLAPLDTESILSVVLPGQFDPPKIS